MSSKQAGKDPRQHQRAPKPSFSPPLYILLSSLITYSIVICMATMIIRPARAFVTKPLTLSTRGLARKARIPSRWIDKTAKTTSSSSSSMLGNVFTSLFAGFGEKEEVDPGNVKGLHTCTSSKIHVLLLFN